MKKGAKIALGVVGVLVVGGVEEAYHEMIKRVMGE